MQSDKDHNRDTGAKPEAHAPQASRAYGRLEKDHSIVQNPESQKEILELIVTSYFCDPASVEELKCAVFIANDNSSKTPNADRWFLKGVFAVLQFMGGGNGKSL